jgi:flagellar motor switch protein FliM
VTQTPSSIGTPRTGGRMSRRAKSSGPQPYDFRRPTKMSREHTRTLQIAYETFARQCATLLTSTLRVVSQVSLVSIEQLTYDEYVSGLSNPTMMAKVTLDPLPGTALVEWSMGTAMACIDHMLGGPGGTQPQRPLTDIETVLMRGLLDRVLGELRYAFEPIGAVTPNVTALEYNPQFVQACSASDAVIVAYFDMRVGAEDCVATVCLPFGPVFAKLQVDEGDAVLTEAERASRELTYLNVAAGLEAAPIEVAVRFEPVTMRPEDIVGLSVGDVVPLGHAVTAPLTVAAADITFAHAVPGNQGSRLACLVVASPKEITTA